jgi:hypothetical protein
MWLPWLVGPMGFNGYAMSFTGRSQVMAPKTELNLSEPALQQLSRGLSYMAWLKFDDLDRSRLQPSLVLARDTDPFWFMPFPGTNAGYQLGTAGLPTVLELGLGARQWHHYTLTWRPSDGERTVYIDGQLWQPSDHVCAGCSYMHERVSLYFGLLCYVGDLYAQWGLETLCNRESSLSGAMDDVALFSRALSSDEVSARWQASLSQRISEGLEPDLAFYYDFDSLSLAKSIPNLGTAGREYDLVLASQKPGPDGSSFVDAASSNSFAFTKPVRVPGPTLSPFNPQAPFVVAAAANQQVSLARLGIANTSVTAPSPLTSTAVLNITAADASGQTLAVAIHIVPLVPPSPGRQLSSDRKIRVVEDGIVKLQLWGSNTAGLRMQPVICEVPRSGHLWELDDAYRQISIRRDGQQVVGAAGWVYYQPAEDRHGLSLDSIKYALRLEGHPKLQSPNVTVSIDVDPLNDLPTTSPPPTIQLVEDFHPEGVLVSMPSFDSERKKDVDIVISRLPTQGRLYVSSNGQLDGARTLISEAWAGSTSNDVPGSFSQYAASVEAVSSFFGNSVSGAHHPLAILGPPDCRQMGECADQSAWTTGRDADPAIGQRVLHGNAGLLAFVRANHPAESRVLIEYAKYFKVNGETGQYQQCAFNSTCSPGRCGQFPDGGYPDGCLFQSVPPSGNITALVPRDELVPHPAGAWAPRAMTLRRGATYRESGMFGAQYAATWTPEVAYEQSQPRFTEFIELGIEKPVYITRIDIGFPRGGGGVVTISAKAPSGRWIVLYEETALRDEHDKLQLRAQTYWDWSPPLCHAHFLSAHLRLEIDTSQETGIADWNYVDYMRVVGEVALPPAYLTMGVQHVLYVPNDHARGEDSFEYRVSDCSSDAFRSVVGTVHFNITSVNDAPIIETPPPSSTAFEIGQSTTIRLAATDVDHSVSDLMLEITALPDCIEVRAGGAQQPISSVPTRLPPGVDTVRLDVACEPVDSIEPTTQAVTQFLASNPLARIGRWHVGKLAFAVVDQMGLKANGTYEMYVAPTGAVCSSGHIQRRIDGGGGAVACVPCPPGQYEVGHSLCLLAPSRSYVPTYGLNESGQLACPYFTRYQQLQIDNGEIGLQAKQSAFSIAQCSCEPGHMDVAWRYGYHGRKAEHTSLGAPQRLPLVAGNVTVYSGACMKCLDGATCKGGIFPPIAKQGYGLLGANGSNFIRCKNFKYCSPDHGQYHRCDCLGGSVVVQSMVDESTGILLGISNEVRVPRSPCERSLVLDDLACPCPRRNVRSRRCHTDVVKAMRTLAICVPNAKRVSRCILGTATNAIFLRASIFGWRSSRLLHGANHAALPRASYSTCVRLPASCKGHLIAARNPYLLRM